MSDEKYNQLAEAVKQFAKNMGVEVLEDLTPEEIRNRIIFNITDPKLMMDQLNKRREQESFLEGSKGRGAISHAKKYS